jgi:fibro-slime domain-containing protein
LKDVAGVAGLAAGGTYAIDIFKAERHTSGSTLAVTTTFPIH